MLSPLFFSFPQVKGAPKGTGLPTESPLILLSRNRRLPAQHLLEHKYADFPPENPPDVPLPGDDEN